MLSNKTYSDLLSLSQLGGKEGLKTCQGTMFDWED